jgi:hypothetical protein
MAGITEEQGDKIIDLLEDILSELKSIDNRVNDSNSELFQHRVCHRNHR